MTIAVLKKMEHAQVLDQIKAVAKQVLPKGSALYLYGSRARGDYHADSDWDLLILLDNPATNTKEKEDLSFAFVDKGWDIGEDISARVYTKDQWENGPRSLFYFNVEEDKKLLYES